MCEKIFYTVEIPKTLKQCTRCLKIMTLDKFYTNVNNKSGYSCDCKKCNCEVKKLKRIPVIKETIEPGYKRCIKCKEIKPAGDFYTHNQHKDGLSGKCKQCELEHQKNLRHTPKKIQEILPDGCRRCKTCLEVKELVCFRRNENTCKCCWSKINSKNKKLKSNKITKPRRTREDVILIESKVCNYCMVEKSLSQFHKDKTIDGYSYMCKDCKSKRRKELRKINKQKSKVIIIPETQTCRQCNVVKPITDYHKKSSSIIGYNNVCIFCINTNKLKKKRDRTKEYKADLERMKTDSEFRIKKLVRTAIRNSFNLIGQKKELPSAKYGINFDEIYKHIGDRPDPSYHLDHIIPLAAFDFNIPEHVSLSHLPENLRWIPNKENLSKQDTIIWSLISESAVRLDICEQLKIKEEHDGMDAAELKKNGII